MLITDCVDFLLQGFIGCKLSRDWQDKWVYRRSMSVNADVLRMRHVVGILQNKLTYSMIEVCLVWKVDEICSTNYGVSVGLELATGNG